MRCKIAVRLLWNWYTVQTPAAKAAYEKHMRRCAECRPMIDASVETQVFDDEAIARCAAQRGVTL